MRFALLGNHPDGLAFARALSQTGRHEIAVITTPLNDDDRRTWGGQARLVRDLEEVLADPSLEGVIVAGSLINRPVQLRRSLQSERHVLCAHPPDLNPDIAYEAAMLQQDTGMVLLPLLPLGLHPAVTKLREWLRASAEPLRFLPSPLAGEGLGVRGRGSPEPLTPNPSPARGEGSKELIELEFHRQASLSGDAAKGRTAVPGWDLLRRLGGDVAEVTGFSERPELSADAPLFVSGTFQHGGQFQLTLRPHQDETRGRLTATTERGRAELTWVGDGTGPARLTWQAGSDRGEAAWDAVDLWGRLVDVFEQYVARAPVGRAAPGAPLSWQDEVRSLELDDAVVRSVEKRRAMTLEYPEATEEAGFKGTMTLLGCGLLWLIVLLLILSVWVPWLGWLVLPVLVVFLALQSLLWVARRSSGSEPKRAARSLGPRPKP